MLKYSPFSNILLFLIIIIDKAAVIYLSPWTNNTKKSFNGWTADWRAAQGVPRLPAYRSWDRLSIYTTL